MKQIKKTIWLLITNDKQNSFITLFWVAYFFPFRLRAYLHVGDEANKVIGTALTILFISFIFASFLSSGLSKLRKTYIARINKYYEKHLTIVLYLFSFVFSTIVAITYYENLLLSLLFFLVAFTTIIHFNMRKKDVNTIKRILYISIPVLLFMREKFMINEKVAVTLLIIHVTILFLLTIKYFINSNNFEFDDFEEIDEEASDYVLCGGKLSYKIGKIVSKFRSFKSGNLGYALLTPTTKTGFSALLYLVLAMVVIILSNLDFMSVEIIINMILVLSFMQTAYQSRRLIVQTTKFAHLFTGKDHIQFKNKILASVDKVIIQNSFIYITILSIIISILPVSVNFNYLYTSSLALLFLAMAYYPIVYSYGGVKLVRMFPLSIYIGINSYSIFWIYHNQSKALTLQYIIPFVIVCITFRVLSQMQLWNTSYEELLHTDIL